MGQDPREIRQDIEQTRERMGDTVEALGYKADVPGRMKQGAHRAVGIAQENPLGLVIGAAAMGFIGGMLIPGTRVEDEKIGPLANQVKEKAKETGQEAVERGKEVARQTADSAKETAQEVGREQAEGLRDSAQEKAQTVS